MSVCAETELVHFAAVLGELETGYQSGQFKGRGYSVIIEQPVVARVTKLFARELGGSNRISFNLYKTGSHRFELKPCEMSSQKVIDFVLNFEPDRPNLIHKTIDDET